MEIAKWRAQEGRARIIAAANGEPIQSPTRYWERVPRNIDGKIYFVLQGEYIKIGFTRSLEKRLAALRYAYPLELIVLLIIDGDEGDEETIHRRLHESRKIGEWFRQTPEVLGFIADRKAQEVTPC